MIEDVDRTSGLTYDSDPPASHKVWRQWELNQYWNVREVGIGAKRKAYVDNWRKDLFF